MTLPEAPGAGGAPGGGGALVGGIDPERLTLTNAFEAAFRGLGKVAFIGPILLFSCLMSAFLELVILDDLLAAVRSGSGIGRSMEEIRQLLVLLGVTFLVTIAGGALIAIYGQSWAVAASVGPFPDVRTASEIAGKRWVGILGTSIVVALLLLPMIVLGALLVAALGREAFLIGILLLLVPFVLISLRLSMATWLAADGASVRDSVRGSWHMTRGNLLRIVGWSLATGLAFSLLSAGLSAILGIIPLVGSGIAQGLSYALTYAAGATLYRRTQAAASPPARTPAAPPVPEPPLG